MAPPPRKKLPIQKRYRSVPFSQPFIRATIFTSFFILSLIALIAVVVAITLFQSQEAVVLLVVLFTTLLFWAISIFVRRSASCPLCKGTPYFNSGARTHAKATKLPLINHGMSNIIRTLTVQTFRCMYCGQPYDLLKPVNPPPLDSKRKRRKAPTTRRRRRRR